MNRGLMWLLWFLEFAAFAILLGGVSAMQRHCGKAGANYLTSGGSAGYLSIVSCDRLFGYAWWTTFYGECLLDANSGRFVWW